VTAYWRGNEVDVTSVPVCRGRGKERETWSFTVERGQLVLRGYWVEMLPTRRHKRWREVRSIGRRWPSFTMLASPNGIETLADVPMDNARAAAVLDAVMPTFTVKAPGQLSLPSIGYRLREHAPADAAVAP